MNLILQTCVPTGMARAHALPGVAQCAARDFMRVDDAYPAQMMPRITEVGSIPKLYV